MENQADITKAVSQLQEILDSKRKSLDEREESFRNVFVSSMKNIPRVVKTPMSYASTLEVPPIFRFSDAY
jgi:hypothetical protein